MNILRLTIVGITIFYNTFCSAQSYNQEHADLSRYLERMYYDSQYEGVKVFTDYQNTYLLSVVSLDSTNYQNSSTMNRVASVKAASQASKFFNGSRITSECIIRTVEKPDNTVESVIEETINEHAAGYVNMIELLTSFESDNHYVFIYGKKIDIPSPGKKRGKR